MESLGLALGLAFEFALEFALGEAFGVELFSDGGHGDGVRSGGARLQDGTKVGEAQVVGDAGDVAQENGERLLTAWSLGEGFERSCPGGGGAEQGGGVSGVAEQPQGEPSMVGEWAVTRVCIVGVGEVVDDVGEVGDRGGEGAESGALSLFDPTRSWMVVSAATIGPYGMAIAEAQACRVVVDDVPGL